MNEPTKIVLDDVKRLCLGPGDTLVVKLAEFTAQEELDAIRDRCREAFPDNRVMVLDAGVDLSVLEGKS